MDRTQLEAASSPPPVTNPTDGVPTAVLLKAEPDLRQKIADPACTYLKVSFALTQPATPPSNGVVNRGAILQAFASFSGRIMDEVTGALGIRRRNGDNQVTFADGSKGVLFAALGTLYLEGPKDAVLAFLKRDEVEGACDASGSIGLAG